MSGSFLSKAELSTTDPDPNFSVRTDLVCSSLHVDIHLRSCFFQNIFFNIHNKYIGNIFFLLLKYHENPQLCMATLFMKVFFAQVFSFI